MALRQREKINKIIVLLKKKHKKDLSILFNHIVNCFSLKFL